MHLIIIILGKPKYGDQVKDNLKNCENFPIMASLCRRIVLNAARRNISYSSVRFCKGK